MMVKLKNHPVLGRRLEAFAPMTDEDRLAVSLRHIVSLDPEAVYMRDAGAVVIYYISPWMKDIPPGGCGRIVYDKRGHFRRIDRVGFDPRGSADPA